MHPNKEIVMQMKVKPKALTMLVDEIKGDELYIRNLLEKYRVGSSDYDKVCDKIEKIERNTIRLVNLKNEYEDYFIKTKDERYAEK